VNHLLHLLLAPEVGDLHGAFSARSPYLFKRAPFQFFVGLSVVECACFCVAVVEAHESFGSNLREKS